MDKEPIFYRIKDGLSKTWTPAFITDEQNGLINIKNQDELDMCRDGAWFSKEEIEIKGRKL